MGESQNYLLTANNRKEALKALTKNDGELNVSIKEKFRKVKQYQERELMLQMNNKRLHEQHQNLRNGNNTLIDEIAEQNCNCDKFRQQINYYEDRNGKERKEARDKLDAKVAYYRNAMVGAYEEYTVLNLEGDQKVYEMKSADELGMICHHEKSIKELSKELEKCSASEKIKEVDRVINMLSKEDKELVRHMRSDEEEGACLSKQIKQVKFEIADLKKN